MIVSSPTSVLDKITPILRLYLKDQSMYLIVDHNDLTKSCWALWPAEAQRQSVNFSEHIVLTEKVVDS